MGLLDNIDKVEKWSRNVRRFRIFLSFQDPKKNNFKRNDDLVQAESAEKILTYELSYINRQSLTPKLINLNFFINYKYVQFACIEECIVVMLCYYRCYAIIRKKKHIFSRRHFIFF